MEPRQYWDAEAATFDDEPDHGLRDPAVFDAWLELLSAWLPRASSSVLDVGCGTGSLSAILAGLGHRVTAVDFSKEMVARAKAKAGGQAVCLAVMDAAALAFAPRSFDVIVCRHLLWALPNPPRVLERWSALLRPGGRLLLVEGYWSTDAGIRAGELIAELPASLTLVAHDELSEQSQLWGKRVSDERYAIIADLA
jgi:SAM-dependent methyltransferase